MIIISCPSRGTEEHLEHPRQFADDVILSFFDKSKYSFPTQILFGNGFHSRLLS